MLLKREWITREKMASFSGSDLCLVDETRKSAKEINPTIPVVARRKMKLLSMPMRFPELVRVL